MRNLLAFLSALVVLASSGTAWAAYTPKATQNASNTTLGSADSRTLAYPQTIAIGDIMIVAGAAWGATGAPASVAVTGSRGTFTVHSCVSADASVRLFIAWSRATSAGAETITVNPAGASSDFSWSQTVFTGALPAIDVDAGCATGTGTAPAGSVTPTASNDLLLGVMTHNGSSGMSLAPGTNYTQFGEQEQNTSTQAHNAIYRVATTPTSYSVAWVTGSATWDVLRIALKGAATTFSTDSASPPRPTINGTPFFPRIAYDSGESSNFADISVANLNLGQYKFTHYLNYQFGPLSKVLPQLTPLPPLNMYGFATGNSVTTFPALVIPTTAPTPANGAAGNVDVGAHSYKVSFTIPAVNGLGNHFETQVGPASTQVTVSSTAKQINLTNIPLGIPGTFGRKIYRTVAGDTGAYKLVLELTNNTATSAVDNIADVNLGADAPAPGSTFAVTENPLVSGVPFRTHFDTLAEGAGGFYITDEPQAQASGFGLLENILYWRAIAEAEMPHLPRFYALFPEGPLSPETSPGSGVESVNGSVGFTEHLISVANPYWWMRQLPPGGNDWIGDDIYVNFHNETTPGTGVFEQGGFPHFLVADRAAFNVHAATLYQKVPVLTLQLFGPFQQGRFPSPEEMWQHTTMAVAEGIRGLAWWQIGTNLGLRDQTEPTKTNANTALINITTFLQQNETQILSTPITGRLTNSTQSGTALNWRKNILPTVANGSRQTSFGTGGRGLYIAELNALNAGVTQWSPMLDQNGDVRMRVFQSPTNPLSFLVFAYNYHPSPRSSVVFTFDQAVGSVTVVDEARTITPSGSTWTDNFGGASSLLKGPNRASHIYQVTLINTPPTDPTFFTCTGVTSSVTSCTWTASSDAEPITYSLERSPAVGCTGFSVVATTSSTSALVTGMAPNDTRCYRVRATDGTGFSGYSGSFLATTLPLQSVVWHWTDLSTDETAFALVKCEPVYPATTCDPTGNTPFTTVGPGIVDFTDTASPKPTVCGAVKAQKTGASDSTFTATVCATAGAGGPTIPNAPSNLRVNNTLNPTAVWSDLSTDETGFKLESRAACGSGSYAQVATPTANVTSQLLATPSTALVQVRIRATNAAGDSAYSNEYCWSRWGHSTTGLQSPPPTHGAGLTPPAHGSLP